MTWDSNIVNNASASADVGEVTVSSHRNAISKGYGYVDATIYEMQDYPMVGESFDPVNGGVAGTWYKFSGYKLNPQGNPTVASFGNSRIDYKATPKAASEGSAYSFAIETETVTEEDNNQGDGGGMMAMMNQAATGALELYTDGTLLLSLDYRYMGSDPISGYIRQFKGSQIEGTWIDNGDGTLTLSYDHSTAVLTQTSQNDQ